MSDRTCFQPNKTKDISGQKFGELTAIRFDHRDSRVKGGPHYWLFKCECGNEVVLRKNAVTSGNTKRCSCCSAKRSAKRSTKHGYVGTRLYREWAGIIQRCTNPNNSSWDRYGAKGITVCDDWMTFEPFAEWALSNGYSDALTIDRIDSTGNYEPHNCRWADTKTQANNKLTNKLIRYNGEIMTLRYWSDRLGIKYHTLYDRINKFGWSIEKAFSTPVKRKHE